MALPGGLYTVNYHVSSDNNATYSAATTRSDLARAKQLGFNTVRVFLWASDTSSYSIGPYTFPSPTVGQLAVLTDFCAQAATVGVKLHVTLFDHWGNFGQITNSKTWISAVVGALNLAQVACIELQNEIRFGGTASYTGNFDAGWPGYPTVPSNPTVGPIAIAWAQLMIPYIRGLAGSVPVVVSNTNYSAYDDLVAAVTNLTGSAKPDWFEWHCYVGQAYPGDTSSVMASLSTAIAIVGAVAPLYIGEAGFSSYPSGTRTATQALQMQRDYIHTLRWCCQQLGLPEPAPWVLFDASIVQTGSQAYYGLIDATGALKPAGALYQRYPLGGYVSGLDINGLMSGAITDSDGNVMPSRWSTYRGNTGAQPLTTAIDTTTFHIRGQSVVLSSFSGTSSSDNAAAIQYYPSGVGWPTYNNGSSYTFDVWLKGSGAVGAGNGLPALTISWYQADGTYISGSNSATIDLSSGAWTHASVGSVMPSAAGYARVFVRVGYGTGRVWVSDAKWSGQLARLAMVNGQWLRLGH